MKIDINKVFSLVEEYDSIIISGHIIPDGDCYGSVMGLTLTLKEFYPNKKITAVVSPMKKLPKGLEQAVKPGTLGDEEFKKSLCFILDLANTPRLDEPRMTTGAKVIKIDHHVLCENFGDYEFVDNSRSSCCEIVGEMCLDKFGQINSEAATAFMLGLTTDTGRFLYSFDPNPYRVASRLLESGARLNDIYTSLYTQDLESFKFRSYVYSNFEAKDGVAYIVFRYKDLQKLGVDTNYAASNVNQIATIDGYPIWMSFAEYEDCSVRVELRCTRDYNVQPLAVLFGGGGHKQASGCKLNNIEDYIKVVKEAQQLNKWKIQNDN